MSICFFDFYLYLIYILFSNGAISRTLGHETYHYVESENTVQAKEISDFVIDTLTRLKGERWVNDMYAFYEKNGYDTLEKQKSELVADQMFEVFANERAVKEFAVKDESLFQKVADHIKKLLNEIKNIYKKLVASGNYEDIAAWQEDLDALQKLNDMMLDALSNIEQRKNTGQKAEKNTSEEVRNSAKRTFSYEELTSKPDMKLTELSESVPTDADGKIDRGALVDKAIKNVKAIGQTNKNSNGEVFVKDVGRDVAISKASVRHGIDRRIEIQAPVLIHIGEIIRNSIEVNQLIPKKNTASGSYILLGVAKDSDNIYVVSSVVNRYTNSIDSIDVLYSANIKKESAVSKTRASGKSLQSLTDSTISISDLLEIVKDKTPEILSSDVLKHFGMTRGNGEIENALMFSTKREQLDIINETNPAPNIYSTWIRTVDDIKTLSETLDDPDWDYEEFNPDLTRADIKSAIEKGKIKVYSSYPIKNGVFVSPSRMEAESYSGNGKIYQKTVDINDVAWIDPTQGQYAKVDVKFATSRLTNTQTTSYTINDDSPLSYNNRAKPNPRSSINWVYKSGLFSVVENKLFHQKISEINQGSKVFKKNADGEYMLPIENKIVFTDGDYDKPYISKIIEVIDEYATNFETIKGVIFDEERGKTGHREAVQLVKQVFGDGLIVQYKNNINEVYGWSDRKRKGKNRRAVIDNYIREQNRIRNNLQSKGNQSIIPSTKREFSISEDASDYILDTKEYQDIIKIVDQRYNLTNKKKLSPKAIDRLAGSLLAKSKSKYDKGALTERLSALFDYMANSDELVWEDVMKTSAEIAHDILSKSSTLDRSMQNMVKYY